MINNNNNNNNNTAFFIFMSRWDAGSKTRRQDKRFIISTLPSSKPMPH